MEERDENPGNTNVTQVNRLGPSRIKFQSTNRMNDGVTVHWFVSVSKVPTHTLVETPRY